VRLVFLSALAVVSGCCINDIEEMTVRNVHGPDVESPACADDVFNWGGSTEVATFDAATVDRNESGRGSAADWVQVFGADGGRVALEHTIIREHTCNGGCPTTIDFYAYPEVGTYTLVHFRSGGKTTDDAALGEYDGQSALVTELVVVADGPPNRR